MSNATTIYEVDDIEAIAAILDERARDMRGLSDSATTQRDKSKWYWQAAAYEAAADIVRRCSLEADSQP